LFFCSLAFHLVAHPVGKAITKEATVVAMVLGRSTPDPGGGSPIELSGRDASGLLNLIRGGKALPRQRIASEEAPPALLQVQPTGSLWNEDVMEPGMFSHPGACLSTIVAGKIVSDDENVARRIISFYVGKQSDVVS
jgi:hypothetical protein